MPDKKKASVGASKRTVKSLKNLSKSKVAAIDKRLLSDESSSRKLEVNQAERSYQKSKSKKVNYSKRPKGW